MNDTRDDSRRPAIADAWFDAFEHQTTRLLRDASGTILVAACGDGRLLQRLPRLCPSVTRVMAVDSDPNALDAARARCEGLTLPIFFSTQSTQSLSFAPGVFDGAICARTIATGADLLNTIAALESVVRPGGWIAVGGVGAASLQAFEEMLTEQSVAVDPHGDSVALVLAEHRGRRLTVDDLAVATERFGLIEAEFGAEEVPVAFDGPEALLEASEGAIADVAMLWRNLDIELALKDRLLAGATGRLRKYYRDTPIEDALELVWFFANTAAVAEGEASQGDGANKE